MAVSNLTATYRGDNTWRLTWSGTAPFTIYRNGIDIATTSVTTYDLQGLDANDAIEVIEAAETQALWTYPQRATFVWAAVADAATYQVEEYVSGAWTLRREITDRGEGYFTWSTRVLEDCQTHQFRIIALDAAGNESTAEALTFFWVRTPDAPTIDTVELAGTTLTITAS